MHNFEEKSIFNNDFVTTHQIQGTEFALQNHLLNQVTQAAFPGSKKTILKKAKNHHHFAIIFLFSLPLSTSSLLWGVMLECAALPSPKSIPLHLCSSSQRLFTVGRVPCPLKYFVGQIQKVLFLKTNSFISVLSFHLIFKMLCSLLLFTVGRCSLSLKIFCRSNTKRSLF